MLTLSLSEPEKEIFGQNVDIYLPDHAAVKRIFVSAFDTKTTAVGKETLRFLLVRHDMSLLLVRGTSGSEVTTLKWVREEALAFGTKAVFLDLPRDAKLSSEADLAHIEAGYFSRLSHHLNALFSALSLSSGSAASLPDAPLAWLDGLTPASFSLMAKPAAVAPQQVLLPTATSSPSTTDSSQVLSTNDAFGFRKLIVLLTSVGRVFALDSLSGQVVWSLYFPCVSLDDVVVLRPAIHPDPRLAIVMHSLHAPQQANSPTILSVINPLRGAPQLSRHVLDNRISAATVVSRSHHHQLPDSHLLFADPKSHQCSALADGSIAAASQAPLVHYVTTSSRLYGYSCAGKVLWQRTFGNGTGSGAETIVATAIPPQQGEGTAFAIPIKTFASGDVATKYFNPNLLVVATKSHVAVTTGSGGTKKDPVLNVYVIDTITGQELLHYRHVHGNGPVHVHVFDNWIGYQYWHSQAHRFEFVSIELYHDAAKSASLQQGFSSHQRLLPTVLSTAFVAPSPIVALSSTTSLLGITPRHLLLLTAGSRLVAIDSRFLDPRRPPVLSEEDKAEELIAYHPELPITARGQLSYNLTLLGLKHIATAAASLESTTLIFCFGLDLFSTRFAPAHHFDMLQAAYQKIALLATLLLVLLLIFAAKLYIQRKKLAHLWA